MSKLFDKKDLEISVDDLNVSDLYIKKSNKTNFRESVEVEPNIDIGKLTIREPTKPNQSFRDVVNVDEIQEKGFSIVELFNKYESESKLKNSKSLREYFDDTSTNIDDFSLSNLKIDSEDNEDYYEQPNEKVIEKHHETIIEKRIEVEKDIDYDQIVRKISERFKKEHIEKPNNDILGFNFIGEFKVHPEEAKKGDIYRNYVARTTFIYDGKEWVALVKDGNDGMGAYGSGVGPTEARRIVNEESELNIVELNISNNNYQVTANEDIIICNVTSGSFDIMMHPVSSAYKKKTYVKRIGNSGNKLGILSSSAAPSDKVEGQSKITLEIENQSVTLAPKGINWYVI